MRASPSPPRMMTISIGFTIKYMKKLRRAGKNLTRIGSFKYLIGTSTCITQKVQSNTIAILSFAANVKMGWQKHLKKVQESMVS